MDTAVRIYCAYCKTPIANTLFGHEEAELCLVVICFNQLWLKTNAMIFLLELLGGHNWQYGYMWEHDDQA